MTIALMSARSDTAISESGIASRKRARASRGMPWILAAFAGALMICSGSAWCASPSAPDATAANGPTAMVKAVIDQASAVVRNEQLPAAERDKQLRAIAEANFDFNDMARTTLGYHWRQLTPAQRDQFIPLFTSFMEDVYLGKLQDYGISKVRQNAATAAVNFTGQSLEGPDDAEVHSTVALQDHPQPVKVDYLLKRDGSVWKIYDLEIDAISVMANYRNQFNRVINDQGYPALVSMLQKKSQELGATLNK
jgi:phospholipid transport system substrate-binding protein